MDALRPFGLSHGALYGSVARGTRARPGDIDILIWAERPLTDSTVRTVADVLASRWAYPVHCAMYSALAPAVAATALRDAIPFDDATDGLLFSLRRNLRTTGDHALGSLAKLPMDADDSESNRAKRS